MTDGLLKTSDVVKRTNLSEQTVWRAIKSGDLRVFRFGRVFRIDERDMNAWVESKRAESSRSESKPPDSAKNAA